MMTSNFVAIIFFPPKSDFNTQNSRCHRRSRVALFLFESDEISVAIFVFIPYVPSPPLSCLNKLLHCEFDCGVFIKAIGQLKIMCKSHYLYQNYQVFKCCATVCFYHRRGNYFKGCPRHEMKRKRTIPISWFKSSLERPVL